MTAVNKDTLGKLFVDEHGRFWQHISYAAEPTATLKQVAVEEYRGGVIGSPILEGFREPTREELEGHIRKLEGMVTALSRGTS
ncbi:hypothetical protein DKM44_12920 [Deinococcus irradiatisoli]|uniref:Uncharacterized protein n=1 Tax=Deinococcus irradiatisoli TaxID=2202254 RepID=A0A2Z3JFS6_9DEIO|nr:hypothetical protein [Deinococcus irradiatisoli]AWN24023.1 hypothetical protein DKM44_12920 [Deinococcus irradiatisoli]